MAGFMDRLKATYNILSGQQDVLPLIRLEDNITSIQPSSMTRRAYSDTTKAVLAPIKTRIAIDAAAMPIRHVLIDDAKRFKETVKSELNDRLSIRANIDQSGTAFIQDAVMTMLEDGACALVPVEVSSNPSTGNFEILSLRVASITQWYNRSIEVSIYNEITGHYQQKVLEKGYAAVAYNPMYSVMNEPNSTLRRLIDRLSLLDVADGKLFSPQLDLIVQMPYAVRTDRKQKEAARRIEFLEEQLNDRKYGIAYLDVNEKVTQLNRPVTNGLVETVAGLTDSLHSQLGLTPAIFSGTASPEEMVQYQNRTIIPIIKALTDAMIATFLTRTAIRQGHSIMAFRDLFQMSTLADFAASVDLLTRNEIISSNEARAAIGLPPSKDPEADELRNKNLNKPVESEPIPEPNTQEDGEEDSGKNKE